jgi:hypothetical protein
MILWYEVEYEDKITDFAGKAQKNEYLCGMKVYSPYPNAKKVNTPRSGQRACCLLSEGCRLHE